MLGFLGNLVLLDDAKQKLQYNIEDFINDYGTHFIKVLSYGCDASAIDQCECESQEAADSISAGLQAGYFDQSAEIKTKIDNYMSSKTCTYKSYWNTVGTVEGIQLPDPNNIASPNATILE